jgi:hypothetical protein
VTKGIGRKNTEAMGFTWAESPEAALDYALSKHGKKASINILYKSSKMVCAAGM